MEQLEFMTDDEIGKEEICRLAGVKVARLNLFIRSKGYNFPKKTRLVNRKSTYDRNEVLFFLSKHDLKTLPIIREYNPLYPTNDFSIRCRDFILSMDLLMMVNK